MQAKISTLNTFNPRPVINSDIVIIERKPIGVTKLSAAKHFVIEIF